MRGRRRNRRRKETPKGQAPKDKPKEEPRLADKEKPLRDATALQAPPLGLGKASNLNDFASQMRKLATDEFAFQDAKGKVFRASFDRKSIERFLATKTEIGRNVIVVPGTYDFGQKRSTWQLHLWYRHHAESKAGDMTFPEDTDACCLLMSFDQDESTARKWKEAFDRGSLRLTVWFRLASVEKRGGRRSLWWVTPAPRRSGGSAAADRGGNSVSARTSPAPPAAHRPHAPRAPPPAATGPDRGPHAR